MKKYILLTLIFSSPIFTKVIKGCEKFLDIKEYHYNKTSLKDAVDKFRSEGRRIVFTHGCFDILHPGHINLIREAKQNENDVLIVALNSDESAKKIKGDDRPIKTLYERISIIAALGMVDLVAHFDEDVPVDLIKLISPDVLVMGSDYKRDEIIKIPGYEEGSGRLSIITQEDGYSTTSILSRVKDN